MALGLPCSGPESTRPAVPAVEGTTASICSSSHCRNFANSLLHHVYELGVRWLQVSVPVMMEGLPGKPAGCISESQPLWGCSLLPLLPSHLPSPPSPLVLQRKTRMFPRFCVLLAGHTALYLSCREDALFALYR